MKKIKHFNGVNIKLVSPKNTRIKDGHGCLVQVGMLQFNSEYTAKRFIKALSS